MMEIKEIDGKLYECWEIDVDARIEQLQKNIDESQAKIDELNQKK